MSDKSVRELELIIQRLNSQIESKNEQIAELNAFIQTATANTQELIRSFRAFCVKVLESELAYGVITSRDLEMMSLEELLGRSRKMLKQNQEKARSIYDTFKDRLTQKNLMIQGLTDQVSQLKTKLDQRNDEPFEVPDDLKRTPAYLLETDTPLDAIRPAISNTTIAGENERVVSFDEGGTKSTGEGVTQAKLYVQNFNSITEQMKDIHWEVFKLLVESGVSELSRAKMMITEKLRDNDEVIGPEKAARLIRQLTTLLLFGQLKINTGMRWFSVLNLTDTGRGLYIDRYHKEPAETEYQRLVREHENAEHGYIIKDVCQILKDTGKYRSVSMSRKGNHIKLPDNRSCIPDIVCCMKNEMEYYEVECGNHHQSDFNDKCDKLKSITSNLFFVAPNRETVEKKLKPQIEAWIRTHGIQLLQISGVVVYLTSISDLAAGRWTYVYNMQDEKPIFTSSNTQKKE